MSPYVGVSDSTAYLFCSLMDDRRPVLPGFTGFWKHTEDWTNFHHSAYSFSKSNMKFQIVSIVLVLLTRLGNLVIACDGLQNDDQTCSSESSKQPVSVATLYRPNMKAQELISKVAYKQGKINPTCTLWFLWTYHTAVYRNNNSRSFNRIRQGTSLWTFQIFFSCDIIQYFGW